MLQYTTGNLLESEAEALVNTVNTVGVMGKGIALMFKEAFPDNFKVYEAACKQERVQLGRMLVVERKELLGPKWIINFPTKAHWRNPSRIDWIASGLTDLAEVIENLGIKSVAIPPLGAGNGGLNWEDVRSVIEDKLSTLSRVDIEIFEPTNEYQNVAKRSGVEKLTPARALIAELVRRYSILGIDCTLLEVQKLGYFLERFIGKRGFQSLGFAFDANRYGPYSDKLKHMLNGLDGSYLHCDKRLTDARPFDAIIFDDAKKDRVAVYLASTEAKSYQPALEATAELIEGFESPAAMELLATVDWLVSQLGVAPTVESLRLGLRAWPGGEGSGDRKARLFDDRLLGLAIQALSQASLIDVEVKEVALGTQGEKHPPKSVELSLPVVEITIGEIEDRPDDGGKDKAAQALGRKGGIARASRMTPERRAEIARKAAEKRWQKGQI